jgi:hypothetical protein
VFGLRKLVLDEVVLRREKHDGHAMAPPD